MLAPRSSPGWLAPKSAGGCMSLGARESLVTWRMVVPQNPILIVKAPFLTALIVALIDPL